MFLRTGLETPQENIEAEHSADILSSHDKRTTESYLVTVVELSV